MSSTRTSDCRKFSPNIFNKSKCSHCFRQREEHSAAALECNRASRKVSKCGYLFVAPDWDFSNPLYRTKRWQRRWFVLYDDGELTYSVDDHPETVPQACIDMTKVLEVTMAEDVTGHSNSIAITAPDRVTFVKGTCPEESKWWLNILVAFPKSKGRHKRNATFPGGQATTTTTMLQQLSGDTYGTGVATHPIRNRHNSYHKDALTSVQSTSVLIGNGSGNNTAASNVPQSRSSNGNSTPTITTKSQQTQKQKSLSVEYDDEEEDDGVETGEEEDEEDDGDAGEDPQKDAAVDGDDDADDDDEDEDEDDENADIENIVVARQKPKPTATLDVCDGHVKKDAIGRNATQDDKIRCNDATNELQSNNKVASSCLLIEDIRRDEKTYKDIANTITNLSQQKNRWSTTTVNNVLNSHLHHSNTTPATPTAPATAMASSTVSAHEKNLRDETDYHRPSSMQLQHQQQQGSVASLRPKSLPLAANSTPAIVSAIVKKIPPVLSAAGLGIGIGGYSISSTTTNNIEANNNNIKQHSNNAHELGKSSSCIGGGSNNKCKSSPRLQLQLKNLQQKHESNQHRQQQQQQQQQQLQRPKSQQQSHERGDPDGGCNLDDLSTNYLAKTSELRVNPPAEESLNTKKGWLMKQDSRTGNWTKHWFSLSGAALFYYRDPVSEERGVLDGVLDVNSLTNVAEVNASKSYAFQLTTWDQRWLTLASLSPSSRNSWIAILRNIAGLPPLLPPLPANPNNSTATTKDVVDVPSPTVELVLKDSSSGGCSSSGTTTSAGTGSAGIDLKREIEKDFIKAQRNHELHKKQQQLQCHVTANEASPTKSVKNVLPTSANSTSNKQQQSITKSPTTLNTPKTATHFSSDEEYRTASEGGRRDSIDWGSPLSPSPPITTSIMRNRERLYARGSNAPSIRSHKRSHSSPPMSRRSTVDSIGSDELSPSPATPSAMHPVQEELHIDKELQFRLSVVEKERSMLRDEAKERETRMSELLSTLERTEQELNARIHEMETVRDNLTAQLEDAKRNAEQMVDRLSDELEESQKKIRDLEDRLARGIDENEALYKRVHELEGSSLNSFSQLQRCKLKRMDSLSDLTQIGDIDPFMLERDTLADEYTELRSRFEKAVNEIRAMKRELKESQNQFDSLEISYAALKQDLERKDVEDRSQLQMMAARIQDLTLKYSSSERQVRTLKQKIAKSERRRSLSLKGKEQLSISKELELKVCELETKIDDMEKCVTSSADPKIPTPKKNSRRRSLESSAASSTDPLQFMLRLNDLEKRFEDAAGTGSISSSSTPTPSCSTPTTDSTTRTTSKVSEHLIERLRCLETVLVTSRDRLEQSLHQLHNLRSSHNRRSVSPITDRKDSYRFVERSLSEVVKLLRESCETCIISGSGDKPIIPPNVTLLPDSNPVKIALTQLESQLRIKLAELLKQRRVLRERNELTERKNMELLAERIAFESVCFGKLRDSVVRAENPELFTERQTRAEVAETSHLMTMLKAKLSGKCALKSSGTLDVLAGVLARRLMLSSYRKSSSPNNKESMEPIDQNIMDDLLRQQNEINVIAKRYKNNAMENLATGLAAETLSYISSNDLVQGAVQEAWRQAQETVNAELVQSEIAHIMVRNAERFEHSITPSFGYTLTVEERLSFEKFADAVHDALRKEMELAVTQLTQCYKESIQKMKRGQWRLQLEQERKISEGRQLLSDFADIIAHKALVDARIAVLRGDYVEQELVKENVSCDRRSKIGITALQKYESLFEELSNDLQIDNPADILLDADFEFIYKQHTFDFINDRQVLCEISTFLSQLEDSLIALQCEGATPTSAIPRSAISIESLQDVCHKCCDLRQRADQLRQEIHRALNTPCQHCRQAHEKLLRLQQQHDSELLQLQQAHDKEVNAYLQELENQRNACKIMEAEKQELEVELQRTREVMEQHTNELTALSRKLQTKETELRDKQSDQLSLLRKLDEHAEQVRAHEEESNAFAEKCARQDEEYTVLLQERDYLQAELNKERERSRRFERRLEMLELEHSKQLECLQDTYRDQLLTHCTDFSNMASDEESFRQRYQAEIEQLRTLCEKGLSAMESSHRRIVADLEDKHREEIERLLLEKETALAEETQATLAALDAMRKAHQSEVQREVARFKQEFLKQFQKGEHSAYTAKANEEELEELRREILSFSEKFSIKCVENASLEEKLRSTTQKLKQLQQMQQLELRNKQFRAHLASDDPAKDTKFVQGLSSPKDANDDINACEDSEPKLHANFQEDQLDHKDTVAVQSNTLNSSVKSSELSVELMRSSVDIPPSATTCSHIQLACNNTNSTVPVEAIQMVISQKNDDAINKIDVEKNSLNYTNCIDNSNQSVNDVKIRHGDNIDVNVQLEDDDDDELNASLYTYEPCYKQASNLYSFQNRLNSQGLNSSTFGKKLKLATRKTTTPATSFKVGYKSAATRPIFATASFATAITKAASPSPASFVYKATQNTPIAASDQIEANHNSQQLLSPIAATKATNIATADIAERTLSNSHNMKRLASQSSELSQLSDLQQLAAKLAATSITQPVEQPKISSANSNLINRNRLSYNDSSMHKINKSTTLNLDTNDNKAANRISTTENQDIIYSADYDSRHSLHVDEWSKISSSNNNIRIAERSAINLTSFNDFLRKTRDVPMPKIYAKISAKHRPSNTNTISTTTIDEEPIIVTKSKASKPRRAKATTNKSVKSLKNVKPTKSENFEIMVDAGDVSEKEDNRPDVGDAWWQRPRDYSDVLSISSSSTTYLTNTNLDAKQSISDEEDMVSLNGPPPKCSPTSYRRGSDVEQTRRDLRRQRQRAIPPASKRTAARAATANKHLRRFELEI